MLQIRVVCLENHYDLNDGKQSEEFSFIFFLKVKSELLSLLTKDEMDFKRDAPFTSSLLCHVTNQNTRVYFNQQQRIFIPHFSVKKASE